MEIEKMFRCDHIDLYGMFRVWTDTRNTAARNAVMFGLIHPTGADLRWGFAIFYIHYFLI